MEFSAVVPTWTPTAVGDTTGMVDGSHHTIQATLAGQMVQLREVYLGGLAGASSPTLMVCGRTSTIGVTLTALRFAPTHPSSIAIANAPTSYQTATTDPQRSATLGMLLALAFNAFGGIVRRYMGPNETIAALGNTQPLAELSLNAFTGGTPGLMMSEMIVEVF